MRYNNGSVHTEFLPLWFCISRIGSLKLCFLENYGCYEVDFGVKMTARPFSTIHLLVDHFIEQDLLGTSEHILRRKQGDNTPPTSEHILLMPWLIRVTTKQEICFLVYTYISTILLLEVCSFSAFLSAWRWTSASASAWLGSGLLIQSFEVEVI